MCGLRKLKKHENKFDEKIVFILQEKNESALRKNLNSVPSLPIINDFRPKLFL